MTSLLAVYLTDHHAGSAAGVALARRTARNNTKLPGGAALTDLARQIEEDRRTLEHVMHALDIRPSPVKVALARAAELAGRLKLNQRLVRRSPLSAVLELEALALGILGKRKLWQALDGLPGVAAATGVDFAALAERAHVQHQVVETSRRGAAHTALQ
jgi:hypothetical protein